MQIRLSRIIPVIAVAAALLGAVYLQFASSSFFDPDSYYHIAVSNFIKTHGLRYPFQWAEFSTFKTSFADKDILFHILNLPFLFLTNNLVLAGKYAFVFQAALFFLAYIFILKKCLPGTLAGIFLFLPLTSPNFLAYFLQLRPGTLANAFMILGIYFLINKRLLWIFITCLLYSLTHISFFMLIGFAFICEILRKLIKKEFFAKNVYITIAGVISGCLLHPNFPHNLFSLYLNGFVVPLQALCGTSPGSAGELQAFDSKVTLIGNFTIFFSFNVIFWLALLTKRKIGLATSLWLALTSVHLSLAFFGNRYWYQTNVLFFIFFASCLNDWVNGENWEKLIGKYKFLIAAYLIIIIGFLPFGLKQLKAFTGYSAARSAQLEDTGRWMDKNIPANQTIYHSYWNDAPYFICLNPKDNYLNVLDPIYMFYRYPKEFDLLNNLSLGRVDKPYETIGKIFKAKYGYLNKFEPLYRQIRDYPNNFKIIYSGQEGVVFEII